MIGFIVGIACLFGLVRVLRRGRRWGMHGGCGRSGWDGDEGAGWGWRGRGRRGHFFLRHLFQRLDTTPGQEKEVQAAVEDVMGAGRALKDEVIGTRSEIADAFRGDDFNEELMATLLTRHDEKIDALRKSMVEGLARVHATLDPDQRKQLARMLEKGPRWGGPYRSYA